MSVKGYIAPIALAILSLVLGIDLLLGPNPENYQSDSETTALDADVLQYFSVKAEQYNREGPESSNSQAPKKAGQI